MNKKANNKIHSWTIELIWWAISIFICILIILPVWRKVPDFPFTHFNIAYILIFLNGMRYLFLLKHTPFAHALAVKLVIIFMTIPSLVYQIDWMSMFQDFKDEGILLGLVDYLPFEEGKGIRKYIENEYIFFGVGSILTSFLLPFRMIMSIWRVRNRGTV
jgi:hypothetical protein